MVATTEEDISIYRPTWWAIFLYYVSIGIFSVFIVASGDISVNFLRGVDLGINHWLIVGPGYLAGWVIGDFFVSFLLYDHLRIKVTSLAISGPAPFGFFRRNAFLLTKIDKPRTRKRSFWQKLGGYWYIWSVDGQRVWVNLRVLKKTQVEELFARARCGD